MFKQIVFEELQYWANFTLVSESGMKYYALYCTFPPTKHAHLSLINKLIYLVCCTWTFSPVASIVQILFLQHFLATLPKIANCKFSLRKKFADGDKKFCGDLF